MSSNWPPALKAWVQEKLSQATAANKPAVNAELKQILSKAFTDGALDSTDWSTVELESLKKQTRRTTHVPPPPPPVRISLPPAVSSYHPPQPPVIFAPPVVHPPLPPSVVVDTTGSSKKKKKRKASEANALAAVGAAKPAFPSAYTFSDSSESEALARRAARFAQPSSSGSSPAPSWFTPDDGGGGFGLGRKKMKGRMGLGYGGMEEMEVDPNVIDWDHYTIRGTSTKLEKSYLRLTSEPSPADIRPLSVLQQTLQLLKQKWKQNHNYAYALDQFKSMRQDLTVQRIKNEFTVEVYEIHARIALEAKDLGEYNQCQSMLRQLYELGLKGHPQEFLSYRIIYLLHTRNRSDMASLLAQLTPSEKADPGVHHALQVHASLATSNYVRFFRLYNTAPNMSGYIMDHFVERERMNALAIMSKAYMTLSLPYLTSALSFESIEDADTFLAAHECAIYVPPPKPTHERPPNGNPWNLFKAPPPVPLAERVWDCKKAVAAVAAGVGKYRVVDLKGQVD